MLILFRDLLTLFREFKNLSCKTFLMFCQFAEKKGLTSFANIRLKFKQTVKNGVRSRDVNVLTFSIFSIRYDKFSLSVKR